VDCDVIVVGAGISGLAVADLLSARGRRVVLLESRARTGGRLRSRNGLDLGASWFWQGERRVAALVDELGIATHQQYIAGDAMYDGPDGPVRLDGNPVDMPAFRFSDGADALTDAVRRRVETRGGGHVRLGSHVQIVEVGDPAEPVTVTTSGPGETTDDTVRGAHVVLALPPALAIASLDIRPTLPRPLSELAARTPVWMGSITKAVVSYPTPFWRDSGLSGAAVSHRGPLREVHDLSGPGGDPAALFGFAPTTTEAGPIEATSVIAQLVRLFGTEASEPVGVDLADWRVEPATSPPGVEQRTDYSTYGDPRFGDPALGGRLHWTSTETSQVAPGHIEGALAAAERTATTIERHLTRRSA